MDDRAGDADAQLMAAWRAGDDGAFEALYARWRRPVWRWHALRAGRERADELHQETWLAVDRGRERYRERERFAGWLFTIARNTLVDAERRRAVRPDTDRGDVEPDSLAAQPDPVAAVDGQRQARALRTAVAALPAPQREVVLLRWEAGLTVPEIAAHTGAPLDTIKSRLRYALTRLREEFADHGR